MDKIKTSSYKRTNVISDEDSDRKNHNSDYENTEIVSQIVYHRPKRHEKVVVVTIENDDDDDEEVEGDEDTTTPYSSSLSLSISTTTSHDNHQTNIRKYRNNFILFCIFFSINHATGSSCISLASIQFQQQQQFLQYSNSHNDSHNNSDISTSTTTEYGGIGDSNITSTTTSTTRNHIASYQSSMVYISYTITALFGIPSYINNHYYYNYMNSKYGTVLGMYLFTTYVLCFWIAMILYPTNTNNDIITNTTTFTSSIYNITNDIDNTVYHDSDTNHYYYYTLFICHIFIYGGAIIGGLGAAIAWTNQGIYYTQITNRITQQQLQQIQTNNNNTHNKTSSTTTTSTPPPSPSTLSSDVPNSFMIHKNNNNNRHSNIIYLHQQNQQLLANIFAFCILSLETILYLITTLCIYYLHWNWHIIFAFYVFVSFLSTIGVQFLCYNGTEENTHHYEQCTSDHNTNNTSPNIDETNETIIHHNRHQPNVLHQHKNKNSCSTTTLFSTIRLLIYNPKMKYMIGFNVAFALSSVYLNIFITGQVVPQSLPNSTTIDISLLITCHGVVAAMSAIFFGYISRQYNTYCCNNVTITILGSIAFIGIGLPFLFHPSIHDWSYYTLLIFYALQGFGRSIFEGTWKAMYANYFPNDKDAAFANIVFLFGLTSAISYSVIDQFTCKESNSNIPTDVYCVQYRDGTYHNIWTMIWIMIGCSIIAIFSLLRAAYLHSLDIEISYDSSNILTTKNNESTRNGYAIVSSNQISLSDTPSPIATKNVV